MLLDSIVRKGYGKREDANFESAKYRICALNFPGCGRQKKMQRWCLRHSQPKIKSGNQKCYFPLAIDIIAVFSSSFTLLSSSLPPPLLKIIGVFLLAASLLTNTVRARNQWETTVSGGGQFFRMQGQSVGHHLQIRFP